jgi:hypothetical protein
MQQYAFKQKKLKGNLSFLFVAMQTQKKLPRAINIYAMQTNNQCKDEQLCSHESTKVPYWKQYATRNKEKIKAYQKQHRKKSYDANSEKAKQRAKEYRNSNPEKVAAYHAEYRSIHKEKISTYFKEYREEHLQELKQRSRECYNQNRETIIEQNAAYYANNKEAADGQRKEYRAKNADKIKQQRKDYYAKNKQQIIERDEQYRKKRKETDELFRFKCLMRQSIYNAFTRIKQNKCTNTQELLGCTWQQAKEHFENLFQPGMSWSNYGAWHIDHITPVASFTTETLNEMNHISNLQPLWALDNLIKSNN